MTFIEYCFWSLIHFGILKVIIIVWYNRKFRLPQKLPVNFVSFTQDFLLTQVPIKQCVNLIERVNMFRKLHWLLQYCTCCMWPALKGQSFIFKAMWRDNLSVFFCVHLMKDLYKKVVFMVKLSKILWNPGESG